MNFDRFIKNPVLSTVVSILLVILGMLGLISLPLEQYPSIAPPTIQVSTTYSGADAQTVLNSVIAPLEEQINGVENMTYMTSSASNGGSATITVYFKEGTDADVAAVNVQNRVQQAQSLLPSEVISVGVTTQKRQSSTLLIFSVSSDKGQYDNQFLANYTNVNIVPALKRVSGVGDAKVFSSNTYAMRIWLNPDAMRLHNLIPADVTTALAGQNINAAPGSFGENSPLTYEYPMRYKGRLTTATEFENIIIKAGKDGSIIRLKDVANVELGSLSYSVTSKTDDKPAVVGLITQISGSNANDIIKDIKKTVKDMSSTFPPGLQVKYMIDVTDFLYASIEEVVKTLIEAFILVFIVVYVFLQDFRSTLIPAIAVPVSLIGTFFFLNLFGFSINLLTLSALVLAIAIVVDDAIIVVEAVHAKLDQGYKSALTASTDAMHEISGAIISITLVMAAVFIPVSFISGVTGTFYRQFGLTMAIAIVISAVNALTLSPALTALFLKPHDSDKEKKSTFVSRFHAGFNVQYERVQNRYRKFVQFFINHKITSLAIVVGALALTGILMATTSTSLVPDEDTGTVFTVVALPAGSSLDKTQAVMTEVSKIVEKQEGVETVSQIVGYSFIGSQGSNFGTLFIRLKPFGERKLSSTDIIKMIYIKTSGIKSASILALAPPMIPGYSTANGVSFSMQDKSGGDINKLYATTMQFLAALNQRPEVARAITQFSPNYPQYLVDVDVAQCLRSGTTPAAVLAVLQGYYGSLYASNFNLYGKLYRVILQSSAQQRVDPNTLNSIYVRTSDGMAPIQSFIKLKKVYGPTTIGRFNLFNSIDINAAPNAGYTSGDVMKAIAEVAQQQLPSSYGYAYSGLSYAEHNASNSTALIFVLCIVFVYLILSAQYESYILPLSVVLSVPFGLAGAFLFSVAFGHNNNIYMQIALIMLIGLLSKNAILIVEFALERRRMGMAITWSAILGAVARLRPILMTSFAMIVGLLPLMLASGVGANGNSTLGATAVGGMLIGMILQLLIVPALFVVFEYAQEKIKPIRFGDINTDKPSAEVLQYKRPAK